MQVTTIARYPVKSCRGEQLGAAVVAPWGLQGDRRWMLVDADGSVVTARKYPELVLVTVAPVGTGLRVSAADRPVLDIVEPDAHRQVPVEIWHNGLSAALADDCANRWFSELLDLPVRLVFLDDPRQRPVDHPAALPGDVVSFADGHPLLLTTEASLTALNELIAQGPHADEGPLPMTRFRPNVVLRGSSAWAEDDWHRVRIGAATFRTAGGCDRCVITTLDADTVAKGREPLATLARHRRWDGKVWFGVNLIPDIGDTRPTVRLGDQVEVLA